MTEMKCRQCFSENVNVKTIAEFFYKDGLKKGQKKSEYIRVICEQCGCNYTDYIEYDKEKKQESIVSVEGE